LESYSSPEKTLVTIDSKANDGSKGREYAKLELGDLLEEEEVDDTVLEVRLEVINAFRALRQFQTTIAPAHHLCKIIHDPKI